MRLDKKPVLAVVLATHNEADNLERCLESVSSLADEVVIVDGESTDDTVGIAKRLGAKVIETSNKPNFHINKQMAIDAATAPWVLLLDADEVVERELAAEIVQVVRMSEVNIRSRIMPLAKRRLFLRHQVVVEQRDGAIGTADTETVAFFVPRINMFLGSPLRHGGSYPDGVIRLFKKDRARLPQKDVHEQMEVAGRVDWLEHDLLHYDSPTFAKYMARANRYTALTAQQLRGGHVVLSLWNDFIYLVWLPVITFLKLYFRHKGFLDGFPGFVWALFSGLHFALAYMKLGDLYRHAHSH